MVKKQILFSLVSAGLIGLAGCTYKNPGDVSKDLEKQREQNQKYHDDLKNAGNVNDLAQKLLTQGGQPGQIKVSGTIVKDDSKTDPRITIIAKGGIGKDGAEVQIKKESQPILSVTIDGSDLSKIAEEKNIISVGCDEKVVSDFSKERSLEIQAVPAPITEGVMTISAKTVVLCGKIENLDYKFLTVLADELILDSVDFTQAGTVGTIAFNTNSLVLTGSNKIMTKGVDSSLAFLSAPGLSFNVMKEITANEDGKLLLMSSGSNYVAEKK